MSKQGIIIGAHMLESITRGMYDDSRTIFREYIQNACDSIDAAVNAGVLSENEGSIAIDLDYDSRKITVTDNGMGIPARDFRRVMGNVADSDKRHSENRGFRGIGRLCGLAYCGTVRFTAKFRGERKISRLVCAASTLRELLNERDSGINRYTAVEVLEMINEFSVENTDDTEAHYFIVELEDINAENDNLLDYMEVKAYLNMTAPLPYFMFDTMSPKIYAHAEGLGVKIDEYDIALNGDQIFKPYTTKFTTKNGEDEVFDVEFRDIRDKEGRLLAWVWFGVSCFKARIKPEYLMRGIRLRKGNIQVGDESTMQRFFSEERGNMYFIGEVFCVSDGLIPNSRRDYFNDCPECAEFESAMRMLADELKEIYKAGSELNSSYRHTKQAEDRESELKYKIVKGYFVDDTDRTKTEAELTQTQDAIAKNQRTFERRASKSELAGKIAARIKHNNDTYFYRLGGGASTPAQKYTKAQQELLHKVFGIISNVYGQGAEDIIRKIEQGLGLK